MTTQTTNQATLLSQVIEQLENKLFCDLVMDYNDMADAFNYERIYDNDEITLNDFFTSPYDAIRQTNHEGYNDNDDYFIVNGYGHLDSFSYHPVETNCPIDVEELAQWIIDNDSYSDYDIEVTTIDDMLASIEDNINDDENMLYKLAEHLQESYDDDYTPDDVVLCCVVTLSNYDYEGLQEIITLLGINI